MPAAAMPARPTPAAMPAGPRAPGMIGRTTPNRADDDRASVDIRAIIRPAETVDVAMPTSTATIRRLRRPNHAANRRDRESSGANHNLEHDCLHQLDEDNLSFRAPPFKLQIGHSSSIHTKIEHTLYST